MAFHNAAATAFWLIVVQCSSFADRVPEQMDLESAAANLHNQILQYQKSLGEIGMSRFPERFAPSLNQIGDGTSLGLTDTDAQLDFATRRMQQAIDHEHMPGLSKNMELASERLALQQQLASAQLQQAGVTADNVVGRSSQPSRRTASLLSSRSAVRHALPQLSPQQEPLALPQTETATKSWRQRNPALAALILEPVLYGYSIVVWAFVMLVTGISSAFCFYAGNKMPMRLPGTQHLPYQDLRQSGVAQKGESHQRSQYFQYPGAPNLQAPVTLDEEDEEGVEAWIKVPVKPDSRSLKAGKQGYLDDESDAETEQRFHSPTGRCQSYGYVDEQ